MSVTEFTDTNFNQEVLRADLPVMVDFWAAWCGPCLLVEPVIEDLAKEHKGKIKFGKLNVDENLQITAKYEIMSIPTVIIFKDGQEVKRLVGFEGKEGYKKLINSVLNG